MPSVGWKKLSQEELRLAKNWERSMKRSTGARYALVMACIGRGRSLMWHEIDKSRWNGASAAHMYSSPLFKGLQTAWPQKRRWSVLDDSDPTGFKCGPCVTAKAAVKIYFSTSLRSAPT